MAGLNFPQGNELPNDQEILGSKPPPPEQLGYLDLLADYAQLRPNDRVKRNIEKTGAQLEEAWEGTAVGMYARTSAIEELESMGGKMLTPEEANKLYPNMPTPYREPVSALIAKFKGDEYAERQKRRQVIEQAPNYGIASMVGDFAVDVATHLADPVEAAAMVAGGAAFGAAARAGTLGTRAAGLATAVEGGTASIGQKVALNVLEATTSDLATNVALEGQAVYTARKEKIEPFRVEQSLQNIAMGLVAGPTIGVGFSALEFGGRSLGKFLDDTSPEAKALIVRDAVRQVGEGRIPDVGPVREALVRETSITNVDSKFSYTYEKVPQIVPEGKRFFIASKGGMDNGVETRNLTDSLFPGAVQASDNPGVANASAARGLAKGGGSVVEVDASNLRLYDLDAKVDVSTPEGKLIADALAESGAFQPEAILRTMSGRDIIEYLNTMADDVDGKPGLTERIRDGFKEMGYDAVVTNGTTHGGISVDAHNAITFLDETKIKKNGFFEADSTVRNPPAPPAIARAMDERMSLNNRVDLDPVAADTALTGLDGVDFTPTRQAMEAKAEAESAIEEFQMLDEQKNLPKEMRKDLERLKAMRAEAEGESLIIKALQFCVRA